MIPGAVPQDIPGPDHRGTILGVATHSPTQTLHRPTDGSSRLKGVGREDWGGAGAPAGPSTFPSWIPGPQEEARLSHLLSKTTSGSSGLVLNCVAPLQPSVVPGLSPTSIILQRTAQDRGQDSGLCPQKWLGFRHLLRPGNGMPTAPRPPYPNTIDSQTPGCFLPVPMLTGFSNPSPAVVPDSGPQRSVEKALMMGGLSPSP